METKDVIDLLRHQRHDLMNHMQVIQGYLSMGKVEKVQEKLNTVLEDFHQERKLMNLNAPELAVWLIQFNSLNRNIRLTYNIHTEHKELAMIDELIVKINEKITKGLQQAINKEELYHMTIDIHDGNSDFNIGITYTFKGEALDIGQVNEWIEEINNDVTIDVLESNSAEYACTVLIPYD